MTIERRFRHIVRPVVAVMAMAAVAACTAACGGGDNQTTLTKAQVIAQGGRICKAAERKVTALPQLTSEHPFGPGTSQAEHRKARRFLAGYADALAGSLDALARLNAPKDDRQLLNGYIRATRGVVAKLRSASTAPDAKVEPQANEAFAMFDDASKQSAAYGFPKGVCGSGSSS
jgi:hypothetical protein